MTQIECLKQARESTDMALTMLDAMTDELCRMEQAPGQPNYSNAYALLTKLAVCNAIVSKNLEEMWALRAQAGQVADNELQERVTALEAQIEQLLRTMARGQG